LVFATTVGFVADQLDHHPDLHIAFGRVTVSVNTHSIDGLSPFDFELARRIEALIA
jgi:4a-hydroxytetrahydrobiopterin dehydratase